MSDKNINERNPLKGKPKVPFMRNPFLGEKEYYGKQYQHSTSPSRRIRASSINERYTPEKQSFVENYEFKRRPSLGDTFNTQESRIFFIPDVNKLLDDLLKKEDTDSNFKITIEDKGSKVLQVGTASSDGFKLYNIRGTYMLSNLLQELTLAKKYNKKQIFLEESRINEPPVSKLSRLIQNKFWKNLIRQIDIDSIAKIAKDEKFEDKSFLRIYVPFDKPDQYEFFKEAAAKSLDYKFEIKYLPKDITPDYENSLRDCPGFLSLAMRKVINPKTGKKDLLEGWPYVVPGGRFNEFYGWDSYFVSIGLLESGNAYDDVIMGVLENYIFEIENYGKILNANRTYYLSRSQPPFLTDLAIKFFEHIGGLKNDTAVSLLKRCIKAAIKEYQNVWTSQPRLNEETGLSCYFPLSVGIPPECEDDHFDSVLLPFAKKYKVSIKAFKEMYNSKEILEPELDLYFTHDKAIRESGHDTSNRFEGKCNHLVTVDLNSLLYKYEVDIAFALFEYLGDEIVGLDGKKSNSQFWLGLAEKRKENITKYLWNEEKKMFYDYNWYAKKQETFETATTFWPLWAGCASNDQAQKLRDVAIPRFEEFGGIVSTTEASRGVVDKEHPQRQWDYPYGWAPHQMMVWEGLHKYGFVGDARRLAYRWVYVITKVFADYNGTVVEKYDVTSEIDPHNVDAEYGNQGNDFKGVAEEGFGWTNTSYLLGLKYLNRYCIRALDNRIPPKLFFERLPSKDYSDFGFEKLSI